jgi:hypothetical protein
VALLGTRVFSRGSPAPEYSKKIVGRAWHSETLAAIDCLGARYQSPARIAGVFARSALERVGSRADHKELGRPLHPDTWVFSRGSDRRSEQSSSFLRNGMQIGSAGDRGQMSTCRRNQYRGCSGCGERNPRFTHAKHVRQVRCQTGNSCTRIARHGGENSSHLNWHEIDMTIVRIVRSQKSTATRVK